MNISDVSSWLHRYHVRVEVDVNATKRDHILVIGGVNEITTRLVVSVEQLKT
jgi:hypothetical protein